ncbi:MAG: hypothetical protein ACC652_00230 [Acidimicrobiales bacterium]
MTHRTAIRSVLVIVVLALIAASCGDSSDSAADTVDTAVQEGTVRTQSSEALVQELPVTVQLLDAGDEPRELLRYTIPDGQIETLFMTQTATEQFTYDGNEAPASPTAVFETSMVVTVTSTGGSYREESEITSMVSAGGTDPALTTQIDSVLERLVGIANVSLLDDRGRLLEQAYADPAQLADFNASLIRLLGDTEAVAQSPVPLPLEAVGIGSRWKTVDYPSLFDFETKRTSTFELIGLDGSLVEVRVSTQLEADRGTEIGDDGFVVTIEQWGSTTEGAVTIDLRATVPTSSSTSVLEQVLSTTEGSQTFEVVQVSTSTAEVTPGT